MSAPLEWNGLRYAGDDRDHVESFFFKAVAPDAERALWVRGTVFSSARAPSRARAEAWAIAFDRGRTHVAVKRSLPFGAASFARDRLNIAWSYERQRFALDSSASAGAIERGGHRIAWELTLSGALQPFELVPARALYRSSLLSQKSVTPYPDLRLSGWAEIDGERWPIAGWRGMQGHNWGRGNSESYAWCHCNQWDDDEDLVLESASARMRLAGWLAPPLTSACVRYRGRDYAFTAPRAIARARCQTSLRSYAFRAHSAEATLQVSLSARDQDFVGLYYPNPRGPMSYCLNAKLASAELSFVPAGGAPIVLSSRAAALEIGTRRADHGIDVLV